MLIKDIPKFNTKQDEISWLLENQEELIISSKSMFKEADGISYDDFNETTLHVSKGASEDEREATSIKRTLIINTTNVFDSHKDVHIPGLWNKSVKENKHRIKFLQEHQLRFDKIIAHKSDLDVEVLEYDWKDLGFDFEGKTEALTFHANIKQERNPFMFSQYKDDMVDEHSVGMQYVKILLAVNTEKEEYAQNKINWDKYRKMIVNGAEADKAGYFWAVLEAKAIEGSAVPLGSNRFTPALSRSKHLARENQKEVSRDEALTKAYLEFLKN